jgi:hypothetical protein
LWFWYQVRHIHLTLVAVDTFLKWRFPNNHRKATAMNPEIDTALFPVTSCFVGPIKQHGYVVIRLDYLSHSMQKVPEANRGLNHVMTQNEARSLVQKILSTLHELSTTSPAAGGGQLH